MIYILTNGSRSLEPPANEQDLARVELTAAEWADNQDLIRQLRQPWIRNANKDRGIRPARSSSGYVLLSSQGAQLKIGRGEPGYRLTIETPYRLDAFSVDAAMQMIKADAARICHEFGYAKCADRTPGSRRLPVLFELQPVMDYDRSDYYRIKALATAAPDPNRVMDASQTDQKSQGGFEGLSVDERIKRATNGV